MNRLSRLETDCVFLSVYHVQMIMMTFLSSSLLLFLSSYLFYIIYREDNSCANPLHFRGYCKTAIPRESTISALKFSIKEKILQCCSLYIVI